MKKSAYLIILLSLSLRLVAQENKLSFRFSHVLFRELADTIEKTIPVRIYYSDKWVDSLYLDVRADNDSLKNLFDKSLKNTGFFFIITDDNKLILTKGYPIKTTFNREYYEHLRKNALKQDTVRYFQTPADKEEEAINDDYRIFKIGKPSSSQAGGTAFISGTIINPQTGEPIPGVIVYVAKLKAGAVTNQAGYYSLELPLGQYQIEYRMIGFKSAVT